MNASSGATGNETWLPGCLLACFESRPRNGGMHAHETNDGDQLTDSEVGPY